MRVVLIRPVYYTSRYDPEVQEALGMGALAAYLRSFGIKVLLLDPLLSGQNETTTIKRAVSFAPEVVGFSLMSSGDLASTRRLIAGIRAKIPEVSIVVGGNWISTEPQNALNHLPAGTACFKYEGELPLLSFLNALSSRRPLSNVPSMIIKDPEGTLLHTENAEVIEDLDVLPFAVRDYLEQLVRLHRAVNIQGSRGCFGTCRYCCEPGFPRASASRWRGHSPEYIAEEINSITKVSTARYFNFVDDDFLGPDAKAESRSSKFLYEITRRRLRIAFGIQARPSTLKPEVIKALAQAGLCYVFLGIESDDRQVLRKWGRSQDSIEMEDVVKNLRSYAIEVQAGYIPFHQYATLESIKRQAEYICRLDLLNYRTATNRLLLLPGSLMYREMLQTRSGKDILPGPFPSELKDDVRSLYEMLATTLEPLRPAWVHAAAAFPAIDAEARLTANRDSASRLDMLQNVLGCLNLHIKKVLFSLLEQMEKGSHQIKNQELLYRQSLDLGMNAAQELFRAGLVSSPEVIHEAMRKDCGV
ncbi:MAG: radical SAM protein [Syntrophomonadaceae bacterium]